MLHMEILRSPLPHALDQVYRHQQGLADSLGVHLVMTGEMMASRNLRLDAHPVLRHAGRAGHRDKVRFQGQEVACVIADDPYIAKDGCDAIEVDYEPLPPFVNLRPRHWRRARR